MTVLKQYPTPGGHHVTLAIRMDTADEPMVYGSVIEDEYGIATMDLQPGDFFLDVGAYIGTVGLSVAADYPGVRVVMVEAVPENVTVISESIAANGFGDRVWAIHAAASNVHGTTTIPYGAADDDASYRRDNRFVGGLGVLVPIKFPEVPNITLGDICKVNGDVEMLKIDCEGCEYEFLDSPSISRVRRIIGEWHDGDESRIVALLDPTHHVSTVRNDGGIGIFEAKRR